MQALADATQRPVEVSPVIEATTLGAAFLAGLAIGTWGGWDDIGADVATVERWSSPARRARPRPVGAMPSSGPRAGSPTCPALDF